MSAPLNPVLTGTTVAVTAHRRAQEQGGAFERHGARVVYAPALKLAPADEDDDVLAAARDTIASPPGTVLVTTGYGVKRWLAVAEEHGLREDLLAALRASTVLARGAKAKGQLQALEIPCAYTGSSGRTSELVDRLLAADLSPGRSGRTAAMDTAPSPASPPSLSSSPTTTTTTPSATAGPTTATTAAGLGPAGLDVAAPHVAPPGVAGPVTVQVHGTTDEEQLGRLRAAGLDVRVVAPYRWESADEGSRLANLVHGIVAGRVDYVTFTAAPAVDALFDAARSLGAHGPLVAALREGRCTPVAIGPVCVQPLEEAGIDGAVVPERFRLGAMVRAVCDHAEAAASR